MIGTTKLSTIRERVRKSFHMTDSELSAWLNQQVRERKRVPAQAKIELETLRLLRDALERELKRAQPKPKRPRATTSGRS